MSRPRRRPLIAFGLALGFAASACGFVEEELPSIAQPMVVADFFPEASLPPAALQGPLTAGRRGSAIARHGAELFVVDRDNGALVVLSAATLATLRTIPIGARPEQVAVADNGAAYVTVRHAAEVALIGPGASAVTFRRAVGVEPYGVAVSPDGAAVYVTLVGDRALVTLASDLSAELDRRGLGDLPRGVAVTGQGRVHVVHQGGATHAFDVDSAGLPVGEPVRTPLREDLPWEMSGPGGQPSRGLAVAPTLAASVYTSPTSSRARRRPPVTIRPRSMTATAPAPSAP